MTKWITVVLSLALSACGLADVGTSAAVNAKLQAEQMKQGKAIIDQAQQSVEAANKAAEQRAAGADGTEKPAGQ